MKECEVDRRTRQEEQVSIKVIHISIESDWPGDGGGEGGPDSRGIKEVKVMALVSVEFEGREKERSGGPSRLPGFWRIPRQLRDGSGIHQDAKSGRKDGLGQQGWVGGK